MTSHLQTTVGENAIVGRIRGDEFIIFSTLEQTKDNIHAVAMEIMQVFQKEYVFDGNEVTISGSVGISKAPSQGIEYNTLFKKADEALYYSKKNGNNQYSIFSNMISICSK